MLHERVPWRWGIMSYLFFSFQNVVDFLRSLIKYWFWINKILSHVRKVWDFIISLIVGIFPDASVTEGDWSYTKMTSDNFFSCVSDLLDWRFSVQRIISISCYLWSNIFLLIQFLLLTLKSQNYLSQNIYMNKCRMDQQSHQLYKIFITKLFILTSKLFPTLQSKE
jgi:hypothetical protein